MGLGPMRPLPFPRVPLRSWWRCGGEGTGSLRGHGLAARWFCHGTSDGAEGMPRHATRHRPVCGAVQPIEAVGVPTDTRFSARVPCPSPPSVHQSPARPLPDPRAARATGALQDMAPGRAFGLRGHPMPVRVDAGSWCLGGVVRGGRPGRPRRTSGQTLGHRPQQDRLLCDSRVAGHVQCPVDAPCPYCRE